MKKLLSAFQSDQLDLNNRIVMAPLTRSRATGNLPNDMMAKYYALRASAGLIITEGTAPSPNGLGYPNIPGIFSQQQIDGWKKVTDAVHANEGKIFIQLMHTGRVAHELNLPEGAEVIGPSAIAAGGEMFTPEGLKPHGMPREMSLGDIAQTQAEFIQSAKTESKVKRANRRVRWRQRKQGSIRAGSGGADRARHRPGENRDSFVPVRRVQ